MNDYTFFVKKMFIIISLLILFQVKLFSQNNLSTDFGTLRIKSNPPDAKVFINGEESGKTPFNQRVKPGQKLIEIILEGYESETKYVYIYKKQIINYQVKLKKLDVDLNIDLTPSDAKIVIDGKTYSNQGKFKLASGIHTFSFERDGYMTEKKLLKFDAGSDGLQVFLNKKTTSGALLRSMVIPGWGQMYQDKHYKKNIFPILFAASSAGIFLSIKYYNDSIENYNLSIIDYQNAFLETDIIKYRNKMQKYYDNVETARALRGVSVASTLIVWLWNIVDTIIVPPDWNNNITVSTNLNPNWISMQLSLNIK